MPNEVILRGAQNTVATLVNPCEPWAFVSKIPADVLAEKSSYLRWRSLPSSEHLVFTATEGLNPNVRCNKQNPVRRLHGLIADFDAIINDHAIETILERCPADLKPAYLSRTMHSGGVRLVWLFDAPLSLEVGHLTKHFLKVAWKALHVEKLFAGADDAAFLDLTKLYDVGRDWRKLGDFRLSENVLNYWLFEASKKTNWDEIAEIHIPIEAVAAEVERVYPGRWDGPFEVGKRGVVFFNPNSVNPTASIVTEAGMICFGEDQLFHPWSKIFGGNFVRQFQQDKIGAAVNNVWYDGKSYFRKSNYGVWEPHSKEDYVKYLKVHHGIDAGTDRNDTASEMDRALVYVHENRRVTGVLPKVYDPQELLYFNSKRFLNCASVRVMEPADTEQEWGDSFPWLAEFFDSCFDPTLVPCVTPGRPPVDPKTIFLAWWKRLFCSALQGRLLKGQALFLAGGVDKGKTLLSQKIVGTSMGGSADASHFLNSDSQFNKELLEVGLWCVDDGVASQDPKAHQKFSEMVKRAVANPFFTYRAMYRDGHKVEWHGRVLVTLNDDASSIRILPNLDSSIEDKVTVLQFAEGSRQFPDWAELDDIISSELPFLLRWLLDWTPPEAVMGNKRFGVGSYIHEDLRVKSLNAGGVSDLIELIQIWEKRTAVREKFKSGTWEGNASEWLAEVNQDDALRSLVSKYNPRALGKKFVEASRIAGSRVSIVQGDANHGNRYKIEFRADVDLPRKTVKAEL